MDIEMLTNQYANFVSIETQHRLTHDYHTLLAGRLELGFLRCQWDLRLQ